jgi:predicted DNA-binding transcriptional regulator AlpA
MVYQAVVDMQFNAMLQAPDVTTGRRLSQGQTLAGMRDNYKIAEKETGVRNGFQRRANILCEPDEYRRVKLGEGNRRAQCARDVNDEPTRAPLRRSRGNEYVSARRVWAHPTSSMISASNGRSRLVTPSFLPRVTGTGCQRGTLIQKLSRQTRSAMETRDSLTYPPRGLNREEAARYVGIGTSLFDRLVEEGRMPKPKHIGKRVVWDRLKLDAAFADLDEDAGENSIDRALQMVGRRR